MKVRNPTAVHPVFATACFSRMEQVAGRLDQVPGSQVHAKTMGTTMTMCGQSALSWFKFWDIGFATVKVDRCPSCVCAFERELAHERT